MNLSKVVLRSKFGLQAYKFTFFFFVRRPEKFTPFYSWVTTNTCFSIADFKEPGNYKNFSFENKTNAASLYFVFCVS